MLNYTYETYEQEKKNLKRLTFVIISLFLVSVALSIIGYFLHSNDLLVLFLVLSILSCLIFVILGAE
ncbi:MAG: hypothetical protein ACTSO3_15540, partial [Candidatus Heimdallarchaeaceae archaeon]